MKRNIGTNDNYTSGTSAVEVAVKGNSDFK